MTLRELAEGHPDMKADKSELVRERGLPVDPDDEGKIARKHADRHVSGQDSLLGWPWWMG